MPRKDRTIIIDGTVYNLDNGQPIKKVKPNETVPKITTSSAGFVKKRKLVANVDSIVLKRKTKKPLELNKPPKHQLRLESKKDKAGEVTEPKEDMSAKRLSQAKPHLKEEKNISHPSLPVSQTKAKSLPQGSFSKVFISPFIKKINPQIIRLSLLRVLLSFKLLFAIGIPLSLVFIIKISKFSANEIILYFRHVLSSIDLTAVGIIGGLLLVLLIISSIVNNITGQVSMAIHIKEIDHRSANTKTLLSHGIDFIFKTWINFVVNIFWISLLIAVDYIVFKLVLKSTNTYIVAFQSLILNLALIINLFLVLAVIFAKPMQRAILSVTDKKISWIQLKSYGLVFRNYLKLIPVGVFWLFICAVVFAGVLALGYGEVLYLSTHFHLATRIITTTIGAILVIILLTLISSWSLVFWSSVYHELVINSRSKKVSEYLTFDNPPKPSRANLIFMTAIALLLLLAYGLIFYQNQQRITTEIKNLYNHLTLPNTDELIPRLK
ncbi:MAG: hypothetical protein Q8P54_00680 [bacterium]|nr:hypothetical protein [bacterium]